MFQSKNLLTKMQKPNSQITRIQMSGDGLVLHMSNAQVWAVGWFEIDMIAAYKLDLLTYDTICLGLQRHGSEEFLQICEETEGFDEFKAAIEKVFPNIDPAWHGKLVKPAFAENYMILFERCRATN